MVGAKATFNLSFVQLSRHLTRNLTALPRRQNTDEMPRNVRHCANWFLGQADLGAYEPKFWGGLRGQFCDRLRAAIRQTDCTYAVALKRVAHTDVDLPKLISCGPTRRRMQEEN